MKEIGDYLRKARLENSVSLDEASEDLNLSVVQLENIEEGNIRAFKDVFSLRDLVKDYAKYLGVEIDQIMDEFNDFMFEHTSKISLNDIIESRILKKNSPEEKEKIVSPYTLIKVKSEWKIKPILITLGAIFLILVSIFIIINLLNKENVVTNELMGYREGSVSCEFSY